MAFQIYQADCLRWLEDCPPHAFHAVITDPPYGLREYTAKEVNKLRNGKGGVWRIPPKIGGSQRAPLPRFTVLTPQEVGRMHDFFFEWGSKLGYDSIGVEIDAEYVEMARQAVPRLAALSVEMPGFDLSDRDDSRHTYASLPLFEQSVNA